MKARRQWDRLEREWAALMYACGLTCKHIAPMLRRLPGSVQMRLRADGKLIDRARLRLRPAVLIHSHGYRIVLRPGHPNADRDGRIYEHRLVASEMLGRPLTSTEAVHHLNGNRTDNRPENLEVFSDHASHMAAHREERTIWTQYEDACLKAAYAARISRRQIARRLSKTRCAVDNRIRRLQRHGTLPPRAGHDQAEQLTNDAFFVRWGIDLVAEATRLAPSKGPES